MLTANRNSASTARWNLDALFTGLEDPKIEAVWQKAEERTVEFVERFRGRIDSPDLTSETLLAAIVEYESIAQEAQKPVIYANLLFAANASDPAIGAFMQKQMERSSALSVKLLFFELELQKAPDDVIDAAMATPALAKYRHFVATSRMYREHRLSESEEVILEELANTGARAWQRLFDEVTANQMYKFIDPKSGTEEELNQEEVLDRLRHADRAVRQAAADSFTAGLSEIQRVLAFTYNTLLQDKAVEDRLRKFPTPEHSRHLANELDKQTVDLVVGLCRKNYEMVARYYRVKREILGLDHLTHIDRYAPIFDTTEQVSYEDARHIVLRAFRSFSQTLSDAGKEFFDKDWIDAEPRTGKTGGAFCSSITPDLHPVILMSYQGKLDDVGTLAHELGHGVHASVSREQSLLNFHGTLPLAELASTFGEMLVFESLTSVASDKDKLALYAHKIESVFATVFRQAAMFAFEQSCHTRRREKGELSNDDFADLWQAEIQGMFGDSLTLGEQHRNWWLVVSHFVQVPFYVYAYSFGELLALSLYRRAKKEGAAFEKKYVELLKLGGSQTPFELMKTVGVDLRSEEFWKGGFEAINDLVAEFEKLWSRQRPRS